MKKPQLFTSIAFVVIGASLVSMSPPGQYWAGYVYGFIKAFYFGG